MYIDTVPNRTSPPTILLRESYREGNKVKKRTLANLTPLPIEAIEAIKNTLAGKSLHPIEQSGYSGDSDHSFRNKSSSHSGINRPVIPEQIVR